MREVLPELMEWWRAGETVGLGTVVATFQSAPRPPGASMIVGPGGEAVGSVSGGCVEGAVYELGETVVGSGVPVLQRYGVSDDDAFAVGLTCGGILDVYVEKVSREDFPELESIADDIAAERPVAIATVVDHPDAGWIGRRLIIHPAEHLSRGRNRSHRNPRQQACRRRGARRRSRPARRGSSRDLDLRTGWRTPGRGNARLRVGLRATAADAGLRCHRLRCGRRQGRRVPRLPRHCL